VTRSAGKARADLAGAAALGEEEMPRNPRLELQDGRENRAVPPLRRQPREEEMRRRGFLAAVAMVAATMFMSAAFAPPAEAAARRYAMVVRVLGNTAFDLAHMGAEEAAKQLGDVEIIFVGPTTESAEGQIEIINSLIAQHVDAIMITANDATALVPALKRAMAAGIPVISWDQALDPAGRVMHLAAANDQIIAEGPLKIAKRLVGTGEVAIISGEANSTSQNAWVDITRNLIANDPQYQSLTLDDVRYGDERSDKGYQEALGLVKTYPNLKCIIAYSSIGIAAAAQMVRDEGLVGKVQVTGLGFPNEMVDHVLSGAVPAFAIWNMIDLGYAATMITDQIVTGKATGAVGEKIDAGRMGTIAVGDDHVAVLGDLFVYDKTNIQAAADLINSLSE
jgi:rhamnose transport system substrate-binding protein